MPIVWNREIPAGSGKAEANSRIKTLITMENYGFANGQWVIADILSMKRADYRILMLQHIEGVDIKSGRSMPARALKGADGRQAMFRLHVLSRQACLHDKGGNRIGLFDPEVRSKDVFSAHSDKPQQGDVVEWKGEYKYVDDDTGLALDNLTIMEMRARGERAHEYYPYTVDADGCIMVPYGPAVEMLQRFGKRLVFPEFRKLAKNETQRKITNWWFTEVGDNYRATKKNKTSNKNNPTFEALT